MMDPRLKTILDDVGYYSPALDSDYQARSFLAGFFGVPVHEEVDQTTYLAGAQERYKRDREDRDHLAMLGASAR
jgi:hypothetical protein